MNRDLMRYFFKFLVFALVVVAIDKAAGFVLDAILKKSFDKNPMRFEVRAMYAIEKGDADIAIIGASDASHSYIAKEIEDSTGFTTFNYGKDGCFFIYQNCLINLMLEHYSPKVILWEIGKDCLNADPAGDMRQWQSISDFYPYYDTNIYCRNIIAEKGKFQRVYMYSSLYRFNSKLSNLVEPFVEDEVIPDTKGYVALPNDGYIYPQFADTPIRIDAIDEYKENMLFNTLKHCKERNIRILFCFSPKFIKDLSENTICYRRLKEVAEEFGVVIIDYKNSQAFIDYNTLFKDASHLNDKGAHLYMKNFIPDFKKALVGYDIF